MTAVANGLGDRVLKTITKGRLVAVTGRLARSKYEKEVNGEKVDMTKYFIKLSGFHLCDNKPAANDETPTEAPEADTPVD